MTLSMPCVLMRAGTSRGPLFLRDWLPEGDEARNPALIGAIGASDPLQLDGLGGGSTLNSKVAIVSRSSQPDCDLDYLFAQVGVGLTSLWIRGPTAATCSRAARSGSPRTAADRPQNNETSSPGS